MNFPPVGLEVGAMNTTPSDPRQELLERTRQILANSTAPEAASFDAEAWLDEWLETRIRALGGRTPSQMIGDPDGFQAVWRVLGAMESGAYL